MFELCGRCARSAPKQREAPYLDGDGHVNFEMHDPDNPRNWSARRRWIITTIATLLATNANFASSAPSGANVSLAEHFGVSELAAGLVMTMFLLGFCAGPLFVAPLSEFYGRQYIFYKTFAGYVIFTFLCTWAPNFGAMLVGRFITGTLVSTGLSNAPGVIADVWDVEERGDAMALFSAMTWLGTSLAPVIGGFCELEKDWRWSFYVLLWLGGGSAALMLLIPETHGPTILRRRAVATRKAKIPGYENVRAPVEDNSPSLMNIYKISLVRPWALLFDPISFACAIYVSISVGLYYMLFNIFPIVFQDMRGWNPGVGQLPLLGAVVGSVVAGLMVVIDTKRLLRKTKRMNIRFGDLTPEERLPLAMVGGIGLSVSMFWFSWSAQYNSVHWIVPTLAGGFLAGSMLLIFVIYVNYIVDTYTVYAASAIAANTIARYAFAASVPLFTDQMFDAMGIGGGGSLIAGCAAVLAVVPFVFWKYGKRIRARSKYTQSVEPAKEFAWNTSKDPTDYSLQDGDGSRSADNAAEMGEQSS